MKLFIWICLTQAIWPNALALYHIPSFEVFKPPKILRNDSYFGYSITYDQQYRRLVISAPRENDIGEVYDCEIDKRSCVPIPKNINRDSTKYKHDYWFGATVKAGPDFVVMCSPRYARKWCDVRGCYEFGTYAKCYLHRNGSLELMKGIQDKDRLRGTSDLLEKTMDSFGWSIDVAYDDSIIIGGPGMFTGRAMVYRPLKEIPITMRTTAYTPTFNFGYAVSSGTFINDRLSYAVSSTYGKKGFGDVQFFKEVTRQYSLAKAVDTDVVGSMFGAVLCAAKLYSVRSDLLVGAPTYARGSAYNLGAVYLYIAIKKNSSPKYKRTIVGQKDGSYFGSAIISLGDINGDAKDEVAIGAPFENDGRGAVYLYSGADLISGKTEKTLTWMQRIEPSDSVAAHLRHNYSFGMSLTTLLDYDDNGCKELAIGAPYSDAVVLLRCMAAITVNTKATFPSLQNRTHSGRTDFVFQVCLHVEYPLKPRNITASISTTVEMSHSHARLLGVDATGTFKYETSFQDKQPQYCKDVPFTLPLDGNYEMEIGYQISSTLNDNPMNMTKFDEKRVILSDRSVLTVRDAVWAAECSGNKECVPKLTLDTDFSFRYVDRSYIIGSSATEEFDIRLSNGGEVAYDVCARVHCAGALVFAPPAACVRERSPDGDRLLCAPTKPLRTNNTWNTGPIVLEMTHLTNLDQNITVEILVFNRCKGDVSEKRTLVIPLRGDPGGIVVKGATDIGDNVNMTKDEVYYDGKQIQHVYAIGNRGPTNWVGLSSLVVLELKPYIKYNDLGTVYVSTSNSYSDCLMHSNNTERMYYLCKIDSLTAKVETVKIVVPMFILPGMLDNLEEQIEEISSNFTLLVDGYENISQSIFTTIRLNSAVVPLWVIFLAALVGLFILIIIAFALYECGFLRRKKRDQLKSLRASVRRQTVMRRSTMSQPQVEDRKKILESTAEEEHEDIVLPCPDKPTTAE